MSNQPTNPFINTDRPALACSSLLVPGGSITEELSLELERSLSVDASDGRACASAARLWEETLGKTSSPFLLLHVADMRFVLGSRVTALALYDELQNVLKDPGLGRWISERRLAVQEETSRMLIEYKDDPLGRFTPSQRWIPTALDPFPHCKVREEAMQKLFTCWKELESYGDFRERYLNIYCLHTNFVEGTFFLDGRDTDKLVKFGFRDKTLVSKLAPPVGGAVRNLDEVLNILQDTREALLDIYAFRDPAPQDLTVEILCQWHAKLMKSSRVLYNEAHPTSKRLVYTNIGVTRQTSRVNVTASTHTNGKNLSIQFCPFDEVQKELERFCDKFNEIIRNDSMDPFACAAWISHTFIAIHPFEDGNGRLSRILSSIPLIRKEFPPLCIISMFRAGYLNHLNQTRSTPRDGDYSGLARVLQGSTHSAVDILMLNYKSERRKKEEASEQPSTPEVSGFS